MKQLDLWPDAEPPTAGPVCAFWQSWGKVSGYTGPHHCPQCAAAVEESCRAFDAAVAQGEYNERGYTPNEWRAHMKRKERA
jgi:hypothetical protein